jgi:hypothetical protein
MVAERRIRLTVGASVASSAARHGVWHSECTVDQFNEGVSGARSGVSSQSATVHAGLDSCSRVAAPGSL